MNKIKAAVASAAVLVVSAVAPSAIASLTDYDGPPRWESASVTISVDLQDAASEWGDAVTFTVVPDSEAEISTTGASPGGSMVGGEAHREFSGGNYITSCEISVTDSTPASIVTHELGHCLGLGHHNKPGDSVMHWFAKDYQGGWSDHPTSSDTQALAELYETKNRK